MERATILLLAVVVSCAIAGRRTPLTHAPATPFTLHEPRASVSSEGHRERTLLAFLEDKGTAGLAFKETKLIDDPTVEGWKISTHQQLTAGGLPITGSQLKVMWNINGDVVAVSGAVASSAEANHKDHAAPLITATDAEAAATEVVHELDREAKCFSSGAVLEAFAPGVQYDAATDLQRAWRVPCTAAEVFVSTETAEILGVRRRGADWTITIKDSQTSTTKTLWVTGDPRSNNSEVNEFVDDITSAGQSWEKLSGYNSFDNKGTSITGFITKISYGASYLDGGKIKVGVGMVCPTVVWHEYAHGITEGLDDLWNEAQSGSLNEGFSDIFAMTLDNLFNQREKRNTGECVNLTGSTRWLVGYDCNVEYCIHTNRDGVNRSAMRDMWEPTCINNNPDSVETMNCSWSDGIGCHKNSGVVTKMFAALVDGRDGINGVGTEAAFALVWRAKLLTTQITTFSQFGANLRVSCSTLVGQYVRDLSGNSTVLITNATCDDVDKAIKLVHLDNPVPCFSQSPVIESAFSPRVMLLLADQQDTISFSVSGNVSWCVTSTEGSASVTTTSPVTTPYHYAGRALTNPIWIKSVTCSTPVPPQGTIANKSYNLEVTAFGNGGNSSRIYNVYWVPVPNVTSVSRYVTGSKNTPMLRMIGNNFFFGLSMCGTQSCGVCWVCPTATDIKNASYCYDYYLLGYINTTQFTMTPSTKIVSRNVHIYCTQHSMVSGYYGHLQTTIKGTPTSVSLCAAGVKGVDISCADPIFNDSVKCQTGTDGCCTAELEQLVPYVVSASKTGYTTLKVSGVLFNAATGKYSLNLTCATAGGCNSDTSSTSSPASSTNGPSGSGASISVLSGISQSQDLSQSPSTIGSNVETHSHISSHGSNQEQGGSQASVVSEEPTTSHASAGSKEQTASRASADDQSVKSVKAGSDAENTSSGNLPVDDSAGSFVGRSSMRNVGVFFVVTAIMLVL